MPIRVLLPVTKKAVDAGDKRGQGGVRGYSSVPCRTCQKRTTRWAVVAVSRSKFS
jgi:hypothetical protein